jgi:hypothetical protein
MRLRPYWALLAILLILAVGRAGGGTTASAEDDPRYFQESGYRIDDDQIWPFYRDRGGPRAFGLPISRTFTLLGLRAQIFQRNVLRVTENGSIQVVNLLDSGWMPYTQIGYAAVPAWDPAVLGAAPQIDSPTYVEDMLVHLRNSVPDQVSGYPANFYQAYISTVGQPDPSVTDPGEQARWVFLNLDVWGLPTSRPLRDPTYPNLITQRFERGLMRFDLSCQCISAVPLGSLFKAIITGNDLPADIEKQAPDNAYLRQYDVASQTGPYRPWALPDTDLTYAFLPSLQIPPQVLALPTAGPAFAPTSTPIPRPTPVGGFAVIEPTATPTRAPAPPSPPGPVNRPPYEFTLKLNEAGAQTTLVKSDNGEDARSIWQSVRYERDRNPETSGIGPNIIHNKVYVARNLLLARQIFGDETNVRNFPESVDRYGGWFYHEKPALGEDVHVIGSCEEDGCNGSHPFEHVRLIFRNRNVVSVFYTYGDMQSSSIDSVYWLAKNVATRMGQ